jgi:prolyl 4-hydroxylase
VGVEVRRDDLRETAAPNFIGAWRLEDDGLCERIVDYFERHREAQAPGRTGVGRVDESYKRSMDIYIRPKQLKEPGFEAFAEYMGLLHDCFRDYTDQWAFLKSFLKSVHIGGFNVQKYETGGHFSKLHSERTGLDGLHRVLVWMTYLNDVAAGGETEFPHYGLRVRPLKGRTLIWPAEWTHAHRGCVVESGVKYIITGWMHFPS